MDSEDQVGQFVRGDIADPAQVDALFEKHAFDAVVNFAAETHVDRSIQDSQIFLKTNILGTHTLLEEARKRGDQIKRFHHISTDEVFGSLELNDGKKFNESSPYDPRSPYSASKACAELVAASYRTTLAERGSAA